MLDKNNNKIRFFDKGPKIIGKINWMKFSDEIEKSLMKNERVRISLAKSSLRRFIHRLKNSALLFVFLSLEFINSIASIEPIGQLFFLTFIFEDRFYQTIILLF